MPSDYPPTVIVRHPKENPRKCSVLPLRGYRTAYPRVSKQGTDPGNGLATVEALYIAYRVFGRETAGLLAHYRWAGEFLQVNDFEWGGGEAKTR